MASTHWPTYVLIAIYVLAMSIVTFIANRKNKEGEASEVVGHFLASKAFGPIVLLFTTFASIFSGYTVVGVPNESGKLGFTAIRWVGAAVFAAVSILIIFPRLRRLSMERKYESPGDFIRDRFASQHLSVLITLCLCVPQLLYISVNIYSLGALLEALTDGELSFYSVAIVSIMLILLFEMIGGLRSVAYTDVIQASVMTLVFIIMPIILAVQYGGFIGQVTSSGSCSNSRTVGSKQSGCLGYVDGGVKGASGISQYYVRNPSQLTTVNFLLFSLSLMSFALNPHLLQRAFTAKRDADVRFVVIALFFAPFITMVPGLLTGITYLSNKSHFPTPYDKYPPFMSILGMFREDSNGFVVFLSYVALLAGISGIMSTADSALIGVSNTMSVNIFKNWLTPDLEPRKIVWIGKAISLGTVCIGLGIAIHLYESGIQYGVMLTLQQAILWQAFPAYVFGLYSKISYQPVLLGVSLGILCDIVLISIVFGGNDPFVGLDKSWSSLIGVALNLIVCGVCHWGFAWGEEEEETAESAGETVKRVDVTADQLTPGMVSEIMKNVQEPLGKYYGVFVWLPAICGLISAFHWISEPDPKLVAQFGATKVKSLVYNGKVADVIAGMPKWAFASLIWYVIGCVFGIFAAASWHVDADEDQQLGASVKTDSNLEAAAFREEDANKEDIALVQVVV